MMKIIKAFGIIVPILAVFLAYQLNKKVPDVRYTLSRGIPITFQRGTTYAEQGAVSAQELVVKNIGNAKAENIQIKIKGKLEKYELSKNFASDVPKVISDNTGFSLLYNELPPKGSFTLIFSFIGPGISQDDISISDQNGLCKQALAQDTFSIWKSTISALFTLVYIVLAIGFLSSLFADRWKSTIQYQPYNQVVTRKKPFYVSEDIWNEALVGLLKKKIIDEYFNDKMDESLCYKILTSPKPDTLAEHIWLSLVDTSAKELESMFSRKWEYTSGDYILNLLKIAKPLNFPQNRWDEIHEKLSEKYVASKKVFISFSTIRSITKELAQQKPEAVSQKAWLTYLTYLKTEYKHLFLAELNYATNPIVYLEDANIDLLPLSQDEQKELRNAVYEAMLEQTKDDLDQMTAKNILESPKPTWIKAEDYQPLKDMAYKLLLKETADEINYSSAEMFLESEKPVWIKEVDFKEFKSKAYNLLLKKLEETIRFSSAKDFLACNKPSWIKETDYEALKHYATGLVTQLKFEELFNLLNNIFSNQLLPIEKPDCLSQHEWDTILNINRRLQISA